MLYQSVFFKLRAGVNDSQVTRLKPHITVFVSLESWGITFSARFNPHVLMFVRFSHLHNLLFGEAHW